MGGESWCRVVSWGRVEVGSVIGETASESGVLCEHGRFPCSTVRDCSHTSVEVCWWVEATGWVGSYVLVVSSPFWCWPDRPPALRAVGGVWAASEGIEARRGAVAEEGWVARFLVAWVSNGLTIL